MTRPTPAERLEAIVEQGLCIGCGVCRSIAGSDTVAVTLTETGYQQPVVIGELDHSTVDTIYDVCPGVRVDGPTGAAAGRGATIDPVWGPWRRIVRSWAADPDVRYEGSTGGVLTALGQYVLRTGLVDVVLHTRPSVDDPTGGEPTLSSTEADVFRSGGSRYGPAAPLRDIAEVLDLGRPFAVIAKPCDIAALANLARHDERVDELVRYRLTMVCGGIGPPAFTDGFLERIGIDRHDLTAFRYRGRGCPGPTRAETAVRVEERHYLDFWGDDESMWSLPWRCKICPDGIGELADIAAADTWPGGSPTRDGSETDPGTNAVIARTTAGLELLEAAARDGALTIECDIGPDDMSVYQPHQVRKKHAVAPRLAGIADMGRITPRFTGLRLDELAATSPPDVNERQRAGTRDRIRIGKATEPTPRARPNSPS
ncbi:Coenzyme F420 hydrogenase/dehydrogenase, beta subunit C-terminal domain [Ilumatobacter sp.]|uniref:Coenzyme F420 hydrogenase/dehydrogenase, beta subunit C-terminal domain n=1 Tax=Ilumatobacter sp. TaxID=1967498 RepID=UPI003AF51830